MSDRRDGDGPLVVDPFIIIVQVSCSTRVPLCGARLRPEALAARVHGGGAVPVSLPAPTLHANAEIVSGADVVQVPVGVVVTDLVVTSLDPGCTSSASVGLIDNPHGA